MQVLTTAPLPRPAGTLLKQALRSLRMQTLPAALFEGLVVDDGSTGREAIEALDEVSRRLPADCLDDCMR
jgi:glycosyltransferase involved in cell wall biosynthesis